ncbi:hypothetical protein GCM10025780_01970 [Frondihabitans cladoniiphilus]|uniref:SGNH hydrolase-type esterase domain-containing protein n=1 Tax=Frondihabitans cladoniiphilus TaxID=715785 RepID=A0ABP8VJ58_9MICO
MAGVIVVAGALVAGGVVHQSAVRKASASETVQTPSLMGTKPVAVAIGDSIMDGHGLTAAQAWPALVAKTQGWSLDNLASDGTGYVQLGNDDDTFQAQADQAVKLDPSVVLLSGSTNDLGESQTEVDAATDELVSTVSKSLPGAVIVGVNTFWGDTTPPAQVAAIDSHFKAAVLAAGGTWIDVGQPLAGRADLMQSDDVHPTAAGQKILAATISAKLAA